MAWPADFDFQTLIDKLPAAILVQIKGRIAYANQEVLRILGETDASALVGKPVLSRIPRERWAETAARIARANREGRPAEKAEQQFFRRDGTLVSAEVSSTPYRFQGQDGALVFLRDLSDEIRARETLATKDRLLQMTGAMAQVGGWEFDAATGQGTWTDEVARIHDVDPAVPTDVGFGLGFYTPESRQRIEAAVNAAVGQGKAYDLVLEMVSALGRRKWVRTQGNPVVVDGKVVQVRGIFQDVTGSWLAERAVVLEKEKLKVTLDSISEGVVTTDTDGRIDLVSRSAEKLLGLSQDQARGRPLAEVAPWLGPELPSGERTVPLRTRGKERTLHLAASPIVAKAGMGTVLVLRDLSEQQRLAEAIQRAQNLESIGQLAARVAHDFNNLLSGLFGQLQLASDKIRVGRAAEARANIDRALGVFDRARNLTGQLLTFSRGGAPVREPLDLGSVVRCSVERVFAGTAVAVEFNLSPDQTVAGDPDQLGQVFENLALNARQAMAPDGKVRVVSGWETRAGKRWAVVTVVDNGSGIAVADLPRVFDPFFTTRPGRHGLGLAAVQSIVLRHEGQIDVTSKPGQGASFRVRLPAP